MLKRFPNAALDCETHRLQNISLIWIYVTNVHFRQYIHLLSGESGEAALGGLEQWFLTFCLPRLAWAIVRCFNPFDFK